MKNRTVKTFASARAMAAFAAKLFAAALRAKRGKFVAALSGGRTPAGFFRELARLQLPLDKAVFYMADERRVPLSSPNSNFGGADRAFFKPAGVPRGSLRPPSGAAAYQQRLLADTNGTGVLDVIVLGLGRDGHTASLFPGAAEAGGEALYSEVSAPPGIVPRRRLTLTRKALNKARLALVLAAGAAKKEMFLRAAAGDPAIPAGRLRPRGKTWFLFSRRP